jgi:hypothetical protein
VDFGRLAQQFIDAQAFDARHGRNYLPPSLAFQYKHRIDEIVGGQPVFAHEPSGKNITPHAAHAGGGEPPLR